MQPYPTQKTWPSLLLVSCVLLLAVQAPNELWQRMVDWEWMGPSYRIDSPQTNTIETESRQPQDVQFLNHLSNQMESKRVQFEGRMRSPENTDTSNQLAIRSISPFKLSSWKADDKRPLVLTASKRTVKAKSDSTESTTDDAIDANLQAEEKAKQIEEIQQLRLTQPKGQDSGSASDSVSESDSIDDPIPNGSEITPRELDRVESILPEDSIASDKPLPQPAWPQPTSMTEKIGQLQDTVHDPNAKQWLREIEAHIGLLHDLESVGDPQAAVLIDALIAHAQAGIAATNQATGDIESANLRRFAFAVLRRSEVWKLAHRYDKPTERQNGGRFAHKIIPMIDRFERKLSSSSSSQAWADYLRLDRLRTIASDPLGSEATVRRELAREVLRLSDPAALSQSQLQFLNAAHWNRIRSELHGWAIEPVHVTDLLNAVEQFEASSRVSDERYLVNKMQDLDWSASPDGKALSDLLETHYRNANVRITVTGTLLNRLLPIIQPLTEPVEEDLLGAKVQGSNRTHTQLGIRLIPDNHRIHMQLVANGSTKSMTVSEKGPVKLFNRGESEFNAGKDISIGRRGIFASRARAVASGRTRLLDVKTDYDKIPILGWVVRQIAKDEHDDNRRFMRNHVRNRVSNAAKQRLNEAVGKNIKSVESRVEEGLIQPLRDLDLELKAMEMRTTKERIIVRCRLAGQHQLAAYTPRPRALSGSFMSLQLHQSAINNLLRQIELANERVELEELMQRLQEKFGVVREDISDEIPEGVMIRLADGQPIQVEFDNDRVVVSVKITELKTRRRRWKNITVRARYRANAEKNHVDLNREGGIELTADKIGFRDQIALRGIFTKVMSSYHRFQVLRGRFENDSRLTKLQITQFVAREGWIGVSIGNPPKDRVASESNRNF